MAQTYVSKAYKKGEIKKHTFQDRSVIYGLDEFGPPVQKEVITQVVRPGKPGFWESLHKRSVYEDDKRDRELREAQCRLAIREERMQIYAQRTYGHYEEEIPVDQLLKIERKWQKHYGLEPSPGSAKNP
jgi:hypothetical protein